MAERGHNFTADGARRIVDAVRAVEGEALPTGRRRPRTPPKIGPHFTARLGAGVQDGTNKRWAYPFTELHKATAGLDGWATLSGGRTGTAYNRIEEPNGSSGTYGNNVASSNLTGTFDIKPAADGVPVEITVERVADGTVEYWFSYVNAIDGACS